MEEKKEQPAKEAKVRPPAKEQTPVKPPEAEQPQGRGEEVKSEDTPAKVDETPAEEEKNSVEEEVSYPSARIFYIQGTNQKLNKKCLEYLAELNLLPITINPDQRRLECMEDVLKDNKDVAFAFVLLCHDDMSYHKDTKPADAILCSRQHDIFLLGYLLGHLGKKNVFVVYHESRTYRLPTRQADAIFIPFDKANNWKKHLRNRLKLLGFKLPS